MTRTFSLADDAYDAVVAAKRPGESFSALARRLARKASQEALFDPEFKVEMSPEEAEAWKLEIYKQRDRSLSPRYST